MDKKVKDLRDFFYSHQHDSLYTLLENLNNFLQIPTHCPEDISPDLIDSVFLQEIRDVSLETNSSIYFGNTLRNIKCLILDGDGLRQHPLYLHYKAPQKLIISSVLLPHSPLNDRVYNSLLEVVNAFKQHIQELSGYFHSLEIIDTFCPVVEPVNPTFKEDYRRILLDGRTWLHIEVTQAGLANNIHIVGQSEAWEKKLEEGLLLWDHDNDIVDNIRNIFDMFHYPLKDVPCLPKSSTAPKDTPYEPPYCSICLCLELDDSPWLPQPLCQNTLCGVSFHRECLYQWLVACAGGRLPAFEVATGSCPSCLQPIMCHKKDV